MSGVNKVILVGNLGSKPEMKYTQTGVPVTKFSLATTERWGIDDEGNRKEHTEWHRVTAWRKLAEICNQYLDKGIKVYVEGRIRTNKWTDKDGITRYTTEITADNMVILTPRGERERVEEVPDSPDMFPSSSSTSFPSAPGGDFEDLDTEDDLDSNFL